LLGDKMKVLGNSLVELIQGGPLEVYEYMKDICDNDPDMDTTDLESQFGGKIYLIETKEDLKAIYTCQESKLPSHEQHPMCGGWASIVETPDAFDACEYIGNGKFVNILLCTNNAGGNTFIVPRGIADTCENIGKSIELTNTAWTSNVNN